VLLHPVGTVAVVWGCRDVEPRWLQIEEGEGGHRSGSWNPSFVWDWKERREKEESCCSWVAD
jgi:hypothetical protein